MHIREKPHETTRAKARGARPRKGGHQTLAGEPVGFGREERGDEGLIRPAAVQFRNGSGLGSQLACHLVDGLFELPAGLVDLALVAHPLVVGEFTGGGFADECGALLLWHT